MPAPSALRLVACLAPLLLFLACGSGGAPGGVSMPRGGSSGETPGSGGRGGGEGGGADAAAGDRLDASAATRDDVARDLGPDRLETAAAGPDTTRMDTGTAPLPSDPLAQIRVTRGVGLGYYHSCFINTQRKLECFGREGDGRTRPPGFEVDNVEGSHHGFCTLLPAGSKRFECWGYNPAPFPPADVKVDPIQFGLGHEHGCALNRDHSVTCWQRSGSMAPPAGLKAKSLAIASFFNCAVRVDDGVTCWGINPPSPPEGLRAKLVAVAFHGSAHKDEAALATRHACAITLDDTVKCWGDNVEGTLDVPPDLGPVKDLAAATHNSCALRPDGEPICWGTRKYSSDPLRFHPMPAGLRLKGLRAELATYCGLKLDDSIACWGDEQHDHITLPEMLRVYAP